jgi:hypothetical protein
VVVPLFQSISSAPVDHGSSSSSSSISSLFQRPILVARQWTAGRWL